MVALDAILVPMDGSPLSRRALTVALEEYPEAEITVLHVVDPTAPTYSYEVETDPTREPLHGSEAWHDRAQELAGQLFEEVRETADRHGRSVETETLVGDPARSIVEYAVTEDVDQIIVGSHGRSDADRQLLGSVTETVVFRSPVRVLLVR